VYIDTQTEPIRGEAEYANHPVWTTKPARNLEMLLETKITDEREYEEEKEKAQRDDPPGDALLGGYGLGGLHFLARFHAGFSSS
jgi:hypothetical protein